MRDVSALIVFRVGRQAEPSHKRLRTRGKPATQAELLLKAGAAALLPVAKTCVVCKEGNLRIIPRRCTAQVWNGSRWETIEHQSKRCGRRCCAATHRLSFVWFSNSKLSTVTRKMFEDTTYDHIVLVEDYIGFRKSYLHQFMFRPVSYTHLTLPTILRV